MRFIHILDTVADNIIDNLLHLLRVGNHMEVRMSRILIIEDEIAIADLEKDYLELSDFQVDICSSGDEGLTTALSGDYNLVILDLMLPGRGPL